MITEDFPIFYSTNKKDIVEFADKVYTHRKTKQLFVSRFKRQSLTPDFGSRITWDDFNIHAAYVRRTTKSLKIKEKEND